MAAKLTKVPISELPLPPPSHILAHILTPAPNEPTPSVLIHDVLQNRPTVMRRARLLPREAHFAYVTPMPLEFPYEMPPIPSFGTSDDKFVSQARDQKRVLVGLSETCLRDCLPHLDVGDAFAVLGRPALVPSSLEDGEPAREAPSPASHVRQELVDVLGGHAVLMSADVAVDGRGYAPWSLRYSGHQFGDWAGQLGDGRAISILSTPDPSREGVTYELQLKGAGRTPFSRTADGLAVLRSSIREFLCSEAMHALSIPTTRSLGLVCLPELPVRRERMEMACICTRVAESFIRIGSFEALSPPATTFFLGGGQQEADYEALRILGEWVVKRVLQLEAVNVDAGDAWGKELVFEVARRNARTVAAWQVYGFMHGVINTDNVSIMGLTIDYGPYAFMDVFDPYHICNHSDAAGRYAYMVRQTTPPPSPAYACRALLNALAPLIGAEISLGNKAVKEGWVPDLLSSTVDSWRTTAIEEIKSEMERIYQETYAVEYNRLLRKRLALRLKVDNDQSSIFQPLLDMMESQQLDFHGTFRKLSGFRREWMKDERTGELEAFIGGLLRGTPEPDRLDYASATEQWLQWLEKYANRIDREASEWGAEEPDYDAARERAIKAANPRFVLRQWVLEEVIKKVETDPTTGKHVLAKVLEMACSPFEPWGAEGDDTPDNELDPEIREERRYCSMGEKRLLGFQCSCSS
ncbi:hypothetical protein J3R83DRAFT_11927 [Lanmaoa asiatica]|nr:hypothetical protein J3R83DRAFT_11927 [Lanmaoa asiatica]